MNEKPKARNRLRGLYQENMPGWAADYAHMGNRVRELNLASLRNVVATDELLRRLQPALRPLLEH